MTLSLGAFPIALLLVALILPLAYSLKNRGSLKAVSGIIICSAAVVALYPLVSFLSELLPPLGYTLGKVILFILFPVVTVVLLERWRLRDCFLCLGIRKTALSRSIVYGIIAAAVTILITILVITTTPFDVMFRTIMFFEAFTEEFYFRGFLFLYLLSKTNIKVAYTTSILGFILIHPQHFTSLFLLSTIAQGVLLTVVAHKTKNILGPWIGHGLNRFFPVLIRNILGI